MIAVDQIGLVSLIGLAFGSFATSLVYRLNTEDKVPSLWRSRSFCPSCKHPLSLRDNIPLLSYIFLCGQCRYCQKPIPRHYPLIELSTLATFLAIWTYFTRVIETTPLANVILITAIAFVFLVIFFSDLLFGLIPDEMIAVGSVTALIYQQISPGPFPLASLGLNLLGGLFSSLAFLLVVLVTRFKGLGLGDVKLAFLIGFLLGWPKAAVAFWFSFVFGGAFAVVLLLLKRVRFSDTIPFGPFLVLGTALSALWSKQVLTLFGL